MTGKPRHLLIAGAILPAVMFLPAAAWASEALDAPDRRIIMAQGQPLQVPQGQLTPEELEALKKKRKEQEQKPQQKQEQKGQPGQGAQDEDGERKPRKKTQDERREPDVRRGQPAPEDLDGERQRPKKVQEERREPDVRRGAQPSQDDADEERKRRKKAQDERRDRDAQEDKKAQDKQKELDKKALEQRQKELEKKAYDRPKELDKKALDQKELDKKAQDQRELDRKALEKKAQEKELEKKPLEKKALDHKDLEKKVLDQKPLDQKPLDKKALDPKELDKKALDQKALDQKALDQKTLDQKALDKKALEQKGPDPKVLPKPALIPGAPGFEPKAAEPKPGEPKPAEPKAAEPKDGQKPKQEAAQPEGSEKSIEDLRKHRKEKVEEGGKRVVIEEPGNRTIVRENNRLIIRHSEIDRLKRIDRNVRVEKRSGGETVTITARPGGVEIVSVMDDNGHLLRRYRRLPGGREVMIIDNRPRHRDGGPDRRHHGHHHDHGPRYYDHYVDLPPPVIRIQPERYIVEADRASDEDLEEALDAPPVERVERSYTLDEIRQSHRLRQRMRSVDLDTITFDFGSWKVAEEQVDRLERVARIIKKIIRRNPDEVFLIEGHTDAVGQDVDNLTLSDRRAESVAVILTQTFEVPPENLTTQGYGEQYLKIPTQGAERQNRRVTVRRITPLLSGSPERTGSTDRYERDRRDEPRERYGRDDRGGGRDARDEREDSRDGGDSGDSGDSRDDRYSR